MQNNTKTNYFLPILEYLARFISIGLFLYIFIAHFSQFITHDNVYFDKLIFEAQYLRFLTITALLTGTAGIIVAYIQGKKTHNTFSSITLREKIVFLIIAFFFSTFLMAEASWLFKLLIPVETLVLAYILPRLIGFYSDTKIRPGLYKTTITKMNFRTKLLLSVIFLIIAASAHMVSNIFISYINGKTSSEDTLKQTLYIKSIAPKNTTQAEKVSVEGYNFGWKTNDNYKVMNTYGEIPTSEWTNEKIVFEIPLSIKNGVSDIWVQKPIENDNKNITISNKVKLNVISRFTFYPEAEDPLWKRGFKKISRILFFNFKF